jgi:transitional endoplasmic reticulum ATPase
VKDLYLDFGDQTNRAMLYIAGARHHRATLRDLLQSFPQTRAQKALKPAELDLALTEVSITPIQLGVVVGADGSERVGVLKLPSRDGAEDGLAASRGTATAKAAKAPKPPRLFPEELKERNAVELVYEDHLREIAAYLRAGLSVLVQCDKAIAPHVYPRAVELSGRAAVLDTEAGPQAAEPGEARDLLAAMSSGSAGLIGRLGEILVDLKDTQTLVLASLDLLGAGPENSLSQEARRLAEHLFRHPKASLLGFVDPTLSLPPILASRFPIHLELAGIDRERRLPDGSSVPTLALITLAREAGLCRSFDPAALFKHVSGFNPVQYRDAMRFVAVTARGKVTESEIISALQTFKKGSGQDVQLPDKTFADIGGYQDLVARLKQIAGLMAGHSVAGVPEPLRRQLLPRGLLLHGEPGTGKTLLAKALAKEMNATIQVVSGPEVMDMYVGESERKIRSLFATARRNAPSVVIFDEFDAIASQRTDQPDGGGRAGNAVVAQLLTELDGFREDLDVLVVATTNRIDIIDEALLRPSRFRPIEVPLPDATARLSIATLHARAYQVEEHLPGDSLRLIAEYSEGLNGDEIRAVFQEAATARFLERRQIDLPLLGSLVGRMRERREQRRRRHLGARPESPSPDPGPHPSRPDAPPPGGPDAAAPTLASPS